MKLYRIRPAVVDTPRRASYPKPPPPRRGMLQPSIWSPIPIWTLCAFMIIGVHRIGAASSPPDLMTYQGFLVDGNGSALAPVSPQNYPVIFRLYTAATGGTRLWSEQQIVTVDKGSFSVVLGEGTPVSGEARPALSSVFAGASASERYMSVSVTIGGSTPEILPRLRLMPSPYSFLATSAANLVQPNGSSVLNYANNRVEVAGNLFSSGTISGSFSGNGAGLTGLTSDQIPTILNGNRAFTGNLGIGTTSPGRRLHVGDPGAANSEGLIRLSSRSGAGGASRSWDIGVPETDEVTSGTGYSFVIDDTQAAGTEFMVKFGSGNVGIGTVTPGFPLTFPNVVGDKISLWGQSGNHYGFGIALSTLQIHTDEAGSDIAFGYGTSGSLIETMRIKGNGRVGIGTSTPSDMLQIGRFSSTGDSFLRMESQGGNAYANGIKLRSFNNGHGWDLINEERNGTGLQANGFHIIRHSDNVAGQTALFIDKFTGNVGLGSTAPTSALQIRGPNAGIHLTDSIQNRTWNIYNESPTDSLILQRLGGGFNGFRNNGAIISGSDRRLKKDIQPLENVLPRALKLRPVSYKLLSETNSASARLGFIAQEVEPLFPELVSELAGYKGIAYAELTSVAIAAIQELHAEVITLQTENAALKRRLAQAQTKDLSTEARLSALEELTKTLAQANGNNPRAGIANEEESVERPFVALRGIAPNGTSR